MHKTSSGEEKKYLQTPIARERIYKDLDFWITAILMSIIEEIYHQKELNLEESETIEDTIVRQGSIVFGHLVTFARNMSCFQVDKSETKKVVKQFCQYYVVPDSKIKEIIQNIDQSQRGNEFLEMMAALKEESEDKIPQNNYTAKEDCFGNHIDVVKPPIANAEKFEEVKSEDPLVSVSSHEDGSTSASLNTDNMQQESEGEPAEILTNEKTGDGQIQDQNSNENNE